MTTRRRWSELSPGQRAGIAGAAAVQLTLLGAALADLRHREPDELTAPVWVWRLVAFVNFVGPLAYFAFGRRRTAG